MLFFTPYFNIRERIILSLRLSLLFPF